MIVTFSCKKDDPVNYNGKNCIDNNEDFKPINISNTDFDTYELKFYNNSKLNIIENNEIIVTVISGDKIVFQYTYHHNDSMPDGFQNESIRFEIDNNIDSFILSDNNLNKARALFGHFFFSPMDSGYHWISDGCIKGEKISNEEWQIDINITVTTESNYLYTEMISEIFKIVEK